MPLLLALSCLQGRPMADAFDALCALGADGVQLTPGNRPTPGFAPHVARSGVPLRTHHTFSFRRRKRPAAWDGARCLVPAQSVHPPALDAAPGWLDAVCAAPDGLPALETMYPGQHLGDGAALSRAMDAGLRLAVDVSHLYLQRAARVLDDATLRRVLDYDRVDEVHLSANDGRGDQHRPLAVDTFGLGWAQARLRAGTPVVLECYMHRLDDAARRAQVARARGG